MPYKDFVTKLHKKTKRNYLERVCEHDKIQCSEIAKQYGKEYWDGDRKYGYGGYFYDGRWEIVAREMVNYYGLSPGDKLLDVGCGKGYLLYEYKKLIPGLEVRGIDISDYALENAKMEIKEYLAKAPAQLIPFEDNEFDIVISLGTLHNLSISDIQKSINEINRVLTDPEKAYIMVESFRTEKERVNLLYWQLTCESFFSVEEWQWLFNHFGYKGDYSFIFFE